jgi:hypothetical protein
MIEVQNSNGSVSIFAVKTCTEELKTKAAQKILNAMLANTSEHKLFIIAPVSPSETS